MGVARGNCIADTEQLEFPVRVVVAGLRLAEDQLAVLDRAEIAREGLELQIEVVHRSSPVVDHHLIDPALLAHALARGLPRQIALRAVLGVVVGASQLLGRDGVPSAEMVRAMLDYRGTTAAGLQAIIEAGFRQSVDSGLDAAEAAAQRMKSRYSQDSN